MERSPWGREMKVILQSDIKGVGKRNAVVEVSDGYARNFLLPRKLAVAATQGGVKTIQRSKQEEERREARRREQAQTNAEKVANVTVTIPARAGETGRLFGSVTTQQIADALRKQHGIALDKHNLVITEPIRVLGQHAVTVNLHAETKTTLKIEVVSE